MIVDNEAQAYLRGRLLNWKFRSAHEAAQAVPEGIDEDDMELIGALALAFGNPGWFEGNHGVIVRAAVRSLIGDVE